MINVHDNMKFLLFLSIAIYISRGYCLNNGLALTPPMGWMTWERFRCTTDCVASPKDCISEDLVISMAYNMKNLGFLAAGYKYIVIDDCWLNKNRSTDGSLIPDPIRFPNGMPYLSSVIHNLGFQFGIYEDYGTKTCAGYPGSLNFMEQDIKTFVSWGVDYIKLDGCNSNVQSQPLGYAQYSHYLNLTKRPIVFSCSWPAYYDVKNINSSLAALLQNSCNLWRMYDDIDDTWSSVLGIINYYKINYNQFSKWAAPGHWNDPDMLIIGNSGLNYAQQRVQMGMWAIFAAPLLMSNDLRNISTDSVKLLQNRNILAINQDRLGNQGYFLFEHDLVQVWRRDLLGNRTAIAVLNTDVVAKNTYLSLADVGFTVSKEYLITEGFTMSGNTSVGLTTIINFSLNPTGIEMMVVM